MRAQESASAGGGALVRARFVAVGDELVAGHHVNGNAVTLGAVFREVGVTVVGHEVVSDDVDEIRDAVLRCAGMADLVVVSGGLGPTQDDLTRDGIAAAAGVPLVRDQGAEQWLRSRFAAFRPDRAIPESNWRQADVPVGASLVPNPVGSATGLSITISGSPVYALPGVPREFEAMLRATVVPDIEARFPNRPAFARELVHTTGMWESAVGEAMAPEVARVADSAVRIGFLASGGQTDVVISGTGASSDEVRTLIAPSVAFARKVLGAAVFEGTSLEATVVELLEARGQTVACAESLTAGMLAGRIANVPGASAVLRGGVIPYATELKSSLLGLPLADVLAWQAVSAQTAEAMATAVAERCGATYGVALTGVAGPAEQDGQPPGTVFVAVSGPAGVTSHRLSVPGDRAQIRTYSVTNALATLRSAILDDGG